VLCGGGNNGGDGYLLACMAREAGMQAGVLAVASPTQDDAGRACAEWRAARGAILDVDAQLPEADIYVDALFGTGLTRPIEGVAAHLIEQVNASRRPVLALDLPSGIHADSGEALGVAVRAATTITFVAHKRGLFTGAAPDHAGELVLDKLGLPESLYAESTVDAHLLDMRRMARWLPPRARAAHKGDFGHVLAIGGDAGMGGAIRLTGEAALRIGAGLVSITTRPENVGAINAGRPELMAHAVKDALMLHPLLQRADVIALGPGLGHGDWSRMLWHSALATGRPAVIDADGLNLLAREAVHLPTHTVLTPHPGEAARLLACETAVIVRDRFAAARQLAQEYACVAVLKGAGTLIAHPQGEVAVCPWGNPGMASAGMGDVLTGIIAGLMAQGLPPWRAARLGVALHAQAGDAAAKDGEAGVLASDLFPHLRILRNAWSGDE